MRTLFVSLVVFAGLAASTLAAGALAQAVRTAPAGDAPHPIAEYGGVVPGRPNPPPALSRLARRRSRTAPSIIATWPGFQMLPDGGSRFFVQTTAAVTPTVVTGEGRIEVVFPNTGLHVSNSRRVLDTTHFETPVARAHLERRRRDLVLVLSMRASATPRVSSSVEQGYFFTFLDFPPGRYRTSEPAGAEPPPMRDPSGRASVRAASPESERSYPSGDDMRAMDAERPPVMRSGD